MLRLSVIGNIGSDPELRYAASGTPMLRFSVASNYRTRTADGDWQDKAEWVRCTVMGKRAESLADHLRKGMRVYADGRLEARPWTDQQGNVRAGLELLANDIEFMSQRNEGGQQQSRPQQGGDDAGDLDSLPF